MLRQVRNSDCTVLLRRSALSSLSLRWLLRRTASHFRSSCVFVLFYDVEKEHSNWQDSRKATTEQCLDILLVRLIAFGICNLPFHRRAALRAGIVLLKSNSDFTTPFPSIHTHTHIHTHTCRDIPIRYSYFFFMRCVNSLRIDITVHI